MAQAGYTPIQLYLSTTASAVPTAGNLANGELAINITDGKLYYKDNAGVVKVLAGTGGTGVVAGSNTQVQFNNNGVFGASANMVFNGTRLTVADLADSGLTSGRVTYASTGGALVDSANLTFDGTTLTANALTVTNATTLNAGTANGVPYLNGSKVLTSGSALTFDGTNFGVGIASPTPYQSGSRVVQINSATANAEIKLTNTTSGSAATDGLMLAQWGNDAYLWNGEAGGILFGTSNQEQMRLTSTGLGIGTSSPSAKLDAAAANFVGGPLISARYNTSNPRMGFGIGNANGFPFLGFNVNNANASDAGTFDIAGYATRLRLDNGKFQFETSSASGTAGVAVTWNTYAILDASGNLGLGVTPSAWWPSRRVLQFDTGASLTSFIGSAGVELRCNAYLNTSAQEIYQTSSQATLYGMSGGQHRWYIAPSGTAGNAITFTQAMTLDSSGNLLVGTTSSSARLTTVTNGTALYVQGGNSAIVSQIVTTDTTGNPYFAVYYTDSNQNRGSVQYNRGTGLTLYNTTSDYRAKDILGPVVDSGALIDSVPVYMGKMKGATQERPMFIAHETPEYAHTGEKDAVDVDGKPVYQQMDASALIPVMWAEIQSLRKRLAAAGIA